MTTATQEPKKTATKKVEIRILRDVLVEGEELVDGKPVEIKGIAIAGKRIFVEEAVARQLCDVKYDSFDPGWGMGANGPTKIARAERVA